MACPVPRPVPGIARGGFGDGLVGEQVGACPFGFVVAGRGDEELHGRVEVMGIPSGPQHSLPQDQVHVPRRQAPAHLSQSRHSRPPGIRAARGGPPANHRQVTAEWRSPAGRRGRPRNPRALNRRTFAGSPGPCAEPVSARRSATGKRQTPRPAIRTRSRPPRVVPQVSSAVIWGGRDALSALWKKTTRSRPCGPA